MLLRFSPVIAIAAALILQVTASPSPEYHHERSCRANRLKTVVVFGDSYSDNGNVYQLSGKTWPLAFNYPGRFTNGPNWADNVARDTHVKLYNFAYAGATSDSTLAQGYSGAKGDLPVPGFLQQIEQHYVPLGLNSKQLASTLFIVDFQGNDYLFSPTVTPANVVDRLEKGIRQLINVGARNILIVSNHNFGLIPYFASDPASAEAMSKAAKQEQKLVHTLRSTLQQEFGTPPRRYPFRQCVDKKPEDRKVRIAQFDQLAFYEYLYQPHVLKKLRIKDVKGQCETADYTAVCKNPEDYFYWDSFHATAKVHRELANAILEYF